MGIEENWYSEGRKDKDRRQDRIGNWDAIKNVKTTKPKRTPNPLIKESVFWMSLILNLALSGSLAYVILT